MIEIGTQVRIRDRYTIQNKNGHVTEYDAVACRFLLKFDDGELMWAQPGHTEFLSYRFRRWQRENNEKPNQST